MFKGIGRFIRRLFRRFGFDNTQTAQCGDTRKSGREQSRKIYEGKSFDDDTRTAQCGDTRKSGREQPRKMYEGESFDIEERHKEAACEVLFQIRENDRIGPTPNQLQVIFSDKTATVVNAGAGSGKSTTLVSRVLFLHKFLNVDFDHMAVFTFTRKSRWDFIVKLRDEAKRWDVPLSEKKAKQIVRTFHSKALQVARGLLKKGERIFEFLGSESNTDGRDNTSRDESLDALEEEANGIEGFIALQESADQAEVLKGVYSKCYNGDEQFRKAIATLFRYTITTAIGESDKSEYEKQLNYIDRMSERDWALCDHLEAKWTEQNCWPIEGVQPRTESGGRFLLSVNGKRFFANGYIRSLDIYVVLGRYEGITFDPLSVGHVTLRPGYAIWDKRVLLLVGCDKQIRYISNKNDAETLKTQLKLACNEKGLSAPAIAIRLPGEPAKPVFDALYSFGLFAENLGLPPESLAHQLHKTTLSKVEEAAIDCVSKFFDQFRLELQDRNLITFNQIFARLSKGSEDLEKIGVPSLRSAQHLMIDEFQDISPLIVNFVQGLHDALLKKSHGKLQPSIVCVGDDWQSIYGWRGSSPHFLLDFHDYFEGAPNEPILLQENFRSSQHIIDCGESFIAWVEKKSWKRGIASNAAVKDLPFKVIGVEEYSRDDIKNALSAFLSRMSSDETLYLLAATHAELEPYKNIPDPRLMKTSFHQSKGLESDHVILIGAQPFFGSNNLKNHLYLLARFPQSFDKAQGDEVLRVAYVATTRAKKMCIWFAERKSGNAIDQVPANDQTRRSMLGSDVGPYIRKCLSADDQSQNSLESITE